MSSSPPSDPLDAVSSISSILNTGLDRPSLKAVMDLIDSGVSPEALVAVITELRSEKVTSEKDNEKKEFT
ncbi:hypothetical protein TrVE_jg8897 [Triparma verrucosa]|uniref:Mitotic-spindle organizing protein 1 n=1 Tax=Triparma verrucosa TaxID=1606542 RepID=A0A9W7FLP9_9STRA|nr:hypothetical protein TrVE_jg8897 [Triparma verrucosa]